MKSQRRVLVAESAANPVADPAAIPAATCPPDGTGRQFRWSDPISQPVPLIAGNLLISIKQKRKPGGMRGGKCEVRGGNCFRI